MDDHGTPAEGSAYFLDLYRAARDRLLTASTASERVVYEHQADVYWSLALAARLRERLAEGRPR